MQQETRNTCWILVKKLLLLYNKISTYSYCKQLTNSSFITFTFNKFINFMDCFCDYLVEYQLKII